MEVNTIFWPFDHPAQVDIASYLSARGITTFCDLCDLLNVNNSSESLQNTLTSKVSD